MSEPGPESARIALCEPSLGGNARRYLDECLTSGFVSSVGPFVERFEQAFAAKVGARFAVACASGTAALHIACRLADVKPGDQVFVPSLTFIASANPILYQQAQAVLVDSERETGNLDPALVIAELQRRARIGLPQPKAIIAVHILGQPARLDDLVAACQRHGVLLIEDAAEALGARYRTGVHAGRQVGTVGTVGCFSFNGNKIITSGGGGMITCDDEVLARRARHLSTQARQPGIEYRHDEVGYNYRLTNLAAALGLAQLEQLDEFLARKREIAARYRRGFAGSAIAMIPAESAAVWSESSCWLNSVSIGSELSDVESFAANRNVVFEHLRARNIDSRPIWTPLHLLPPYASAVRLGGGVAEGIFAGGLSLPSSVGLSEAAQDRVIATLLEAVAACAR
jgi:dTDP-4-amino-4,6-dideoxygalactose transaminase